MATSFISIGIIDLASGLAVMLGANVGTTLIVQLLSFNLAVVPSVLILIGFVVFRRGDGNTRVEESGRIVIGLGLMLLALRMLVHVTTPVENSPLVGTIMRSLAGQPLVATAIAAGFTWACHSSVAVMLFIASLAASGAIAPTPALALVLGANLGGTLPAYFESGSATARRLPLGNLLIRATGCLATAPLLPFAARLLFAIEPEPARIVVNFHTLFNVLLAIVFLPSVHRLAKVLSDCSHPLRSRPILASRSIWTRPRWKRQA